MRAGGDFRHHTAKRGMAGNLAVYDRGQDLGLVANLDAVDNMALGQGYITNGTQTINWRKERGAAREALAALGYEINISVPVAGLQMSERTAIAIARAMSPRGTPPKMLILDEPTANLPAAEAERL